MFSRLRSTSLGGLIDLASPRTEPDSPHQNASPGIPPSRQPSLNVHLSTSHRRHPPHSPQATRALDNSKREFTEVIESLQQVRPTDLSQTRALLSLMVAILQDTPDCRECMRENSGFLTLITVLASLEPHILTDSPKSLPLATALSTVPDLSISNHVKLPSIEIEESLSPTLGPARGSASSFPQFQGAHPVITPAEEEQDAVVVLVFRCLALALSNHCENQRFFSTTVGYKLVLDALRLSNLMPRPSSGKSTDSASTRNRRLKAEKLFGVLFAFIVSDFSCTNIFTAVRASVMAQSSENVPNQIPREPEPEDGTSLPAKNSGNHPHQPARPPSSIFKFDCDTKFENMSQLLRQSICDRAVPLRVEIADAVLLFLSLHADLFLSTTPDSDHLEADYELYFLGLKAIEILASTSRRSQICLNSTELTAVLLERLIPFSNAAPIVSTLPAKPNDKESTTQVIPSAGLEPWPSKSLAALFQNRKTINKIGARQCRKSARAIITRMLEVGSSPREARMLFRKSVVAPEASSNGTETLDDDYLEFILSGMQGSCCPPFIHFGSSPDRCAYAVLESLGPNPFPPIQGNGWTFASWLQIESFGTEGRPLELLTICDPTLSCFVRITISNSSHVIVQTAHQDQTSSTSTEPSDCSEAAKTAKVHGHPTGPSRATKDVKTSVEFVGFTFEHNRFYHFAIVQRPETKTSASTISLFIDGESIDTLEVMWPNPPQMQPVSAYFGHLSAPSNQSLTFVHERTDVPIPEHSQAGNSPLPQRRHAATHDRPRWNLGGCWLFHQDLSDQMLFVQSTLGPKIFTCFQDALGSFQTYTSSTLLNLKIDQLHHQAAQDSKSAANAAQAKPGSRRSPSSGVSKAVNSLNKSPLIKAIKEPASAFIPHHSIYFALSAKNGIVIGARRQDEKEPISSPVRSVSGLRHPYVSNESLYHMQQVYTPIDSYFFNRDALNKVATTSGPTSSAFGPSFANGILNAGIPNSKASHYPPDIASSPTRPLHPLSASLSSSSAPIRSASSDQVLQLFGDVTLCSPKGMDDSVWKMSGSIFLIRLVELASTEKQLATTLKIFFEATSHNWRLSEDAEKIQAYETLALVLRSKTRLFTPSIHRILLRFAGIIVDSASTESPPSQQSNASFPTELSSHSSPVLSDHIAGPKIIEQPSDYGLRESVITNPLAFRFLLLDFDLWSGPSYEIQCKHFESLCGMIETSVWSRFSMKRISKMNLLPKMLHSLRIQQFSNTSENPIQNNGDQTVISVFIKLLGCVLRAQFNSQAIRHLASYLTASLAPHQAVKRVPPSSQTKSPLSETFFPPDVAANKHQSGQVLSAGLNVPTSYIKPFCTSTTLDEPLMVLRVFHDLLLSSNEQESRHYIGRFLKAINGSKWLLMFFRADAHPDVILYSLRILTRLAQTQDIGWLQHFKNTLAGFAILRSVLTKFCFESNSVFVTALSMLSQVDIRTVPIFCSAAAGAPGAAPQVTTDDFRTVVRSIRGAPNELVTPEILPIVIALLKPSYVTRSREDKMTPVYAMEWLNLRMESPDDGWNEILGEKEIVKAWANYVTLLDCLPYQEGLYPINQATPSEAASDISHSTTHASCLSSFPLNVTCRCSAGSEDVTEILTGVHTNCPSPTQYVSLSSPKPQWPPSFSPSAGLGKRRKSRFASNATGIDPMLRITIPQSITINGEAVPATPSSCDAGSPRIISASTPCHMDKLLNESRVQPVSVSLYSYDDAREDIVQQMADISKRFLINFLFEHSPSTAITKKTSDETGTTANKTLRLGRAEQLLSLVVDRAGIDRAWITPFINQLIEVIVEETDPNSVPLAWLLTALQDGYLSGWLQPNSKAVSDLVMFIPSRTWKDSTPLLGDLLLIVLANRHTSSPELLLEQMRSRRLAEMIAIFPADVLQRMVYILTQYLSDTVNLRPVACDVLKLIFSYHPSVLEEFCLDIDLAKPVISSPPPLSPSSKDSNVVSCTTNESMSQNERDLAKVLQTGPDELKEVLEKSPSINLAGKLDWVQFLTESEVKASRTKVECRTKSKVTWTEYMNKVTIENRRLEVVLKKMESWARSVCEIDAARFANLRQDNLDNKNYLEIQLSKRVGELYRPYSILAKALDTTAFYWALDSTEGPSRQRRKLRRLPLKLDTRVVQQPKSRHHRMRSLGASRRDSYNAGDASGDDKRRSEYQSPTSPMGNEPMLQQDDIWTAEPEDEDDGGPEISLTRESKVVKVDVAKPKSVTVQQRNGEESGLDDFSEDKCRRILKSLEVNDVIQDAWNIEQVIGLDTCPALFLMAKNNIYIIDGFFQRPNGDIVNSWDAWEERDPHLQTLANLSRQTAKLNSRAAAHQSRRWAYSDIVSMSPRKWLFRDICIEFLFADGRSRLLTFSGTKRDAALKRLRECIRKSVGSEILSNMNVTLKSQTELWQNGQLSNHAYLLYLNDAAGRTYRDLTQHPVFPWILADYTSSELDLEKPESFRKLDLPMGAQSEARKRDFIERYASLEEFGAIGDERMKPAHYMTHYSSAVVVCGFLIRLQPFCDYFIEIQGSFDHADRTFWSIHRAWLSASEQSRSDVRELTPEFFHCSEFLLNLNKLSLGSRQEGGDPIGDVKLPPWAHGDSRLFVELHREALESDFVSEHIHHWIDLIFGYKQRGPAALDAVNVFQEVSYEGTVSLDAIDDDRERSSVLGAMCNWGLTPSQIFQSPHPTRFRQAKHAFEAKSTITASTCSALIQSVVPIRDIQQPIGEIYPARVLEKTNVSGPQSLLVLPSGNHRLDWGFLDQTLRIFDSSNALCGTFEGVSSEHISSACFADHRTLATGSTDSTISLWRFAWLSNGGAHLQQVEVLRGHSAPITCVVASRTLSIIVSGAEDGLAMVWDLNRALLVHSLPHPGPVSLAAISEGTGDIATCFQNTVKVWSINGDLLSTLVTSQYSTDAITACCWSRAEVKPLLVTGHRGGRLMFWQRKSVHAENPAEPWKMELIRTAQHEFGHDPRPSEVCALAMTDKAVLTGDTLGRLFCWALPGSACHLPDSVSSFCMLCDHKFGILEGRKRCISCSAIICSSCQDAVPGLNGRCCHTCSIQLMKLVV